MDAMTVFVGIVCLGLGFLAGRTLDGAIDWISDVLGRLGAMLAALCTAVGAVFLVWLIGAKLLGMD